MKDAKGHGSDARGSGAKTLAEQHGLYKPGMGRSAFASIPSSYFNKDGTLKFADPATRDYVGNRISSLGAALAGSAAHQSGVNEARGQPRSALENFHSDIERSFSTRVQDDPLIRRPSVLKYDNS